MLVQRYGKYVKLGMLGVYKAALLYACIVLLSGCAIAARSDKFGAELDIGIGGFLSYIADLRLKASVGFSKTCTHEKEKEDEDYDADAGLAGLRHFL